MCRPSSGGLEASSDLLRHRFCLAERAGKRGLLRNVGRSSKFSHVLLRDEPQMEVGRSLHHGQVVDALDPGGRLDRRNEPMEKGAEIRALGGRHVTEVQQVAPRLNDDRPGAGLLERGVLDQEVLIFDDVATGDGRE